MPLVNSNFGPDALRPAPINARGLFYYSEDTEELSFSDGDTWSEITLGGGGGGGGGELSYSPQVTTAAPYAVLTTDRLVLLDAPSLTVTLYAGSVDTEVVTIKDYTDDAFNFPHTIVPTAPDTIEHIGALVINSDSGAFTLAYNPVDQNWMVV